MTPFKSNFNQSFRNLLKHLSTDNVMESLALCRYVAIHRSVNKEKIHEHDLKNDFELYETIRDTKIVNILGGEEYPCIGSGYLKFNENFMNEFYKYKIALNYPDQKVAACADINKNKNYLIDKIKEIIDNKENIRLTDNQKQYTGKYEDYVLFTIKHVVKYCSKYDNDFLLLGRQLFDSFDQALSKDQTGNLIIETLNGHLDIFNKEKIEWDKKRDYWLQDLTINDPKVQNLYNNIVVGEKLNSELFKLKLTSHKKGLLGETIFGDLIGGEVVGYKNNKTDIVEDGQNISLKTTYASSWNHHLAYLKKDSNVKLIEALNNKIPFFKTKDINWVETINTLLSGNDLINELVFQKITLDEMNKKPTDIKYWRFSKDDIIKIITTKQFIFQNNNIILFHNQEQFLKFNFKKRSDSYQVMVSVEENALNNAVENNLGQYTNPSLSDKKTLKK